MKDVILLIQFSPSILTVISRLHSREIDSVEVTSLCSLPLCAYTYSIPRIVVDMNCCLILQRRENYKRGEEKFSFRTAQISVSSSSVHFSRVEKKFLVYDYVLPSIIQLAICNGLRRLLTLFIHSQSMKVYCLGAQPFYKSKPHHYVLQEDSLNRSQVVPVSLF